ncbi:MATE family efflux transporter [Propionigenium maris DSM 9537]|uniref:Multidrug-efflux transporter n=1 Tax=Propionigenium maris DSM 9537 TaxID=1123000 RepID=A0A9W6LPE6_9FUSO|nr:MATE family efflux transporter [Propionigenium maris]GLI56855.1 MATE family efflux transporter [Propionigenium maris DSM 9537]
MSIRFYRSMLGIAIPVALQNIVSSSVNLLDTFMIGQLGEVEIAGVGIANRIFFVMALILFGINSGSGIFYSQFWGRRDGANLKKILGLTLGMGVVVSGVFFLLAFIFPEFLIGLYSRDLKVVEAGAGYLRIVSLGYVVTSVSFALSMALRSIGVTTPSLVNSVISLLVNCGLNYLLIFGKLGFPEMGVQGAAIGTLVARFVEVIFFIGVIYIRRYPLLGRFEEYWRYSRRFIRKYLDTATPVMVNELFWGVGMTIHTVVFARMGVETMAALNMSKSLEGIIYVAFIGLSSASVVLVGSSIGRGDTEEALEAGKRIFKATLILGGLNCLIVLSVIEVFLSYYNVSLEVKEISRAMLRYYSVLCALRGSATVCLTGIMRSGGDTKFGMWADLLTLWGLSVPLTVYGGLYLGLSPRVVYLLSKTDVVAKFIIGSRRLYSGRWIKNLVEDLE